jgi:DNA-binding transcriptional LysR family regulator
LRELAARGTVTAVAEALAYTPSAVSQQLAQLERDVGVALLERAGRGVRLTEAGRRLAGHADAIMARMDAAEADLAGLAGRAAGRLRVACFQTAAGSLVLPALVRLQARHAGVQPELVDAEAEEALPGLRLGEYDLVVAEEYDHAPRRRDPALERTELGHDRMLVGLPVSHPLAGQERVALADLAGETWVTARADTLFAAMVARACRAVGGFEPDVRHRSNDLRLLFALIAAQQVVALVPGLGRGWLSPGVVLRPLAGAPLERRIFTAIRRGTSAHPTVHALQLALAEQAVEVGVAASAFPAASASPAASAAASASPAASASG